MSSFKDGAYVHTGESVKPDDRRAGEYLARLAAAYPIASIEDGMSEDDWNGWKHLTALSVVRSSSLVTIISLPMSKFSKKGIADKVANSILIKVNQIGTLSETVDRAVIAQKAGYTCCHVSPLRRNRGYLYCGSGGRSQHRADQDGLGGPGPTASVNTIS